MQPGSGTVGETVRELGPFYAAAFLVLLIGTTLEVLAPATASTLIALVLPGCLQSDTTIHLNKDGSGTLVDKERRLVLTNYHVVQENPNAKVFFPVFRDGSPVAERD